MRVEPIDAIVFFGELSREGEGEARERGVRALQGVVARGECATCSVEVKGPNDRLAEHQLIWLQFMAATAGVDARVIRVDRKEAAAKKGAKAAGARKRKSY